uniref:DUF21 domain-containing protein n=1 Tax=candidate division WOR-3 bacterium TaxID=2052148 RepID=A0A7V4E511_UNCW3
MGKILIFFLLLFFSFNLSGCETAIFSTLRAELEKIKSRLILRIAEKLKQFEKETLFSLLVSNTFVNTFTASIFSSLFSSFWGDLRIPYGLKQFIDILIFTAIILVFGEVSPKLIAVKYPLKMLSINSLVVYPFFLLLKPVAKFIPTFSFKESDDAIGDVLDEMEDLAITSDPALSSRISILRTKVGELMTPRDNIVALKPTDTVKYFLEVVGRYSYSSYPVLDGSEFLGVLRVSDVRIIEADPEEKVERFVSECPAVPVNVLVLKVLKDYPDDAFFAVIDEYGNFVGVLTLWDVLERFHPAPPVKWIGKKSLIVSGDLPIHDMELILRKRIPFDTPTVQSLIMELTGRIPDEGEFIEFEGIKFEIIEKEFAKLTKIKVELT